MAEPLLADSGDNSLAVPSKVRAVPPGERADQLGAYPTAELCQNIGGERACDARDSRRVGDPARASSGRHDVRLNLPAEGGREVMCVARGRTFHARWLEDGASLRNAVPDPTRVESPTLRLENGWTTVGIVGQIGEAYAHDPAAGPRERVGF